MTAVTVCTVGKRRGGVETKEEGERGRECKSRGLGQERQSRWAEERQRKVREQSIRKRWTRICQHDRAQGGKEGKRAGGQEGRREGDAVLMTIHVLASLMEGECVIQSVAALINLHAASLPLGVAYMTGAGTGKAYMTLSPSPARGHQRPKLFLQPWQVSSTRKSRGWELSITASSPGG
ncbi:MAG: hypothetical protein Q9203_003886 [Teloschistes exilis]